MSSYNYAVWEAEPPLSNAHALVEYEQIVGARGAPAPPTAGISRFIDKIEAEVSGLSRDGGDAWAAPLRGQVDGSLLYFGVRMGWQDQVGPLISTVGSELGLVVFDPQNALLVPSATEVARSSTFELPPTGDLPPHLAAIIAEALGGHGAMAGVVEDLTTGYYVQWLTGNGALMIEAQDESTLDARHRVGPVVRSRMVDLGFKPGDPNWFLQWSDGRANAEQAARLLSHVLGRVRGLPNGSPMRLLTFPT